MNLLSATVFVIPGGAERRILPRQVFCHADYRSGMPARRATHGLTTSVLHEHQQNLPCSAILHGSFLLSSSQQRLSRPACDMLTAISTYWPPHKRSNLLGIQAMQPGSQARLPSWQVEAHSQKTISFSAMANDTVSTLEEGTPTAV